MGSLRDVGLLLLWVWLYLAGIAWLARYRQARISACPAPSEGEYRADKDIGLRLLTFLLGVLLLTAAYFLTRMTDGL